jgi:hypothetical protein
MPNNYGRETIPGWSLNVSDKQKPYNIDLRAKHDQLLKAHCLHYHLPINALVPWCLKLLEDGVREGPLPNSFGVGMRYPEKPYSTTIRLSPAEIGNWKRLAKQYGVSPAAVLVVALFELYKREPVDLSVALYRPKRWKEGDYNGQESDWA